LRSRFSNDARVINTVRQTNHKGRMFHFSYRNKSYKSPSVIRRAPKRLGSNRKYPLARVPVLDLGLASRVIIPRAPRLQEDPSPVN